MSPSYQQLLGNKWNDDDDDEAHLTEPSGPLNSEQDALPGAERLLFHSLSAIFVVLPVYFLRVRAGEVQKLQQQEQTEQHRAPHVLNDPKGSDQIINK